MVYAAEAANAVTVGPAISLEASEMYFPALVSIYNDEA
jgi:hypothetical protein